MTTPRGDRRLQGPRATAGLPRAARVAVRSPRRARPGRLRAPPLQQEGTPRGAGGTVGLGARLVGAQPISSRCRSGRADWPRGGGWGGSGAPFCSCARAAARSGPATCAPTPDLRAARNPPLVRTRERGAAACNAALSGSDLGRALSFSVPGFLTSFSPCLLGIVAKNRTWQQPWDVSKDLAFCDRRALDLS